MEEVNKVFVGEPAEGLFILKKKKKLFEPVRTLELVKKKKVEVL